MIISYNIGVLNENGDFIGFDVIIGNPPYFSLSKIKEFEQVFKSYQTYFESEYIYCLFSPAIVRQQHFAYIIDVRIFLLN